MTNLILYTFLSCPAILMVNKSEEPWNNKDYDTKKRAMQRCGEIYKDSPCLKVFVKTEPQSYWAICGEQSDV